MRGRWGVFFLGGGVRSRGWRGRYRECAKVGWLMLFNDTCLISVRIFGVMCYLTWIEEKGYTK